MCAADASGLSRADARVHVIQPGRWRLQGSKRGKLHQPLVISGKSRHGSAQPQHRPGLRSRVAIDYILMQHAAKFMIVLSPSAY